jgi:hypothetical protein
MRVTEPPGLADGEGVVDDRSSGFDWLARRRPEQPLFDASGRRAAVDQARGAAKRLR